MIRYPLFLQFFLLVVMATRSLYTRCFFKLYCDPSRAVLIADTQLADNVYS